MKRLLPVILTFAFIATCSATENDNKAYIFHPTSFGLRVPPGFSIEDPIRKSTDFKSWNFTSSTGSRLTFAIGGHWETLGQPADFKGFAALEFKTSLVRRVTFDSSGFSHSELNEIGRPPDYNALLEYKALSQEEADILDEAIDSFYVQKKNEIEQAVAGYPPQGVGSPDP